MNSIRVLIVEESQAESQFLCEALEEAAELSRGEWTSFAPMPVGCADDAAAVLAARECDIVLLNPVLDGIAPLEAFAAMRRRAPEVPLVIVGSRGEEALGRRMLREGAQDFVVREEIDCGPLARTLRNALDRQRFFNATQRGSTLDPLTALYNERGFQAAASREMRLAAEAGQPLLLVLAEVDNLAELTEAYGREQRELTMLEASEILRTAGGDAALLGCFEHGRFGAMLWNRKPDEFIGAVQARHSEQPRPFAFSFGWALTHAGADERFDPLLTAAEASLCENGGSSPTPDPLHLTQPTASAAASPA